MAPFPSLRITSAALTAQGPFAEAQAAFLQPDSAAVAQLDEALRQANAAVVAHFYMDAELQGVLSACRWPHIAVSDSLVMADRALQMVQAGAAAVCVAGVDFMSENVRAVLDSAGLGDVPVYRLASARIGCSLADAAEADAYRAFLAQAAAQPPALHVIYINTSLRTKAAAHALVPTITCTSSNVVQTVLAAAKAMPNAQIWYGPDTYMGENLRVLFARCAALPPAELAAQFAGADRELLASVQQRFHPFQQGNCIVHHLFGAEVVAKVAADYGDALLTAHLEVPGEMFALAAEAQAQGRGVVGSTSQILEFLVAKVGAAMREGAAELRCVLGTEAGMITSIVRKIQAMLAAAGSPLQVEVIFPVAAEAVAQSGDAQLPLVPGVAAGEGCSVAGGCATCPYMKMNNLDTLIHVARLAAAGDRAALSPYRVRLQADTVGGVPVAELGSAPILHMRHFQRTGVLPPQLIADVLSRQPVLR